MAGLSSENHLSLADVLPACEILCRVARDKSGRSLNERLRDNAREAHQWIATRASLVRILPTAQAEVQRPSIPSSVRLKHAPNHISLPRVVSVPGASAVFDERESECTPAAFVHVATMEILPFCRYVLVRAAETSVGTTLENVADLIGMNDTKTLEKIVEFVVALGILPYLSPGVGVPIAHRLGVAMAKEVNKVFEEQPSLSDDQMSSSFDPHQRLLQTTNVLIRCMVDHEGLRRIIVKKALSDILVGLIQVAYGPQPKKARAQVHSCLTTVSVYVCNATSPC